MRNREYLKTISDKMKKSVKVTAGVMLAGGILLCGNTIVAQAHSLDDVFDAQQYADTYSDLKAAFGYDRQALLKHYRTYGISERREVEGLIDVVKYREMYADLDAAFGDNWDAYVEHFLTYGAFEGRDSGTDFDALAYVERYADLKEVYGDDVLALYQHYQTYGKAEGRNAEAKVNTAPATTVNVNSGSSVSNESSESDNIIKNEDGTYWMREFNSKGDMTKATLYDADGSEIICYSYEYEYTKIPEGHVKRLVITRPDGYREETVYNYMVIDWADGHDVWGYDWLEWRRYDPVTEENWYTDGAYGVYEVEVTDKNGEFIRYDYYDDEYNFTGSYDGEYNPIGSYEEE